MSVKKDRGEVMCRIVLQSGKERKLREMLARLSPRVRVSNVLFGQGRANRDALTFEAHYGPVAGGYQSDVSRFVQRALKAVGCTSPFSIVNHDRKSHPRTF